MIIDLRTYTLYPGKLPEFLKLVETLGLPVQRPILGNFIGYFTTEIGTQNQVVHMWGYESLDDRARRRAELYANEDWQVFISKVTPLLMTMENKIVIPTSFSPIK